jgi:hypothetical protein
MPNSIPEEWSIVLSQNFSAEIEETHSETASLQAKVHIWDFQRPNMGFTPLRHGF